MSWVSVKWVSRFSLSQEDGACMIQRAVRIWVERWAHTRAHRIRPFAQMHPERPEQRGGCGYPSMHREIAGTRGWRVPVDRSIPV
jgi:hypothetical protein